MTLRISGKNIDLGESLRQRVGARVEQAVGKYFDGGWSGHVTVAPEGSGFRAECVLRLDTGVVLEARGDAFDPYSSCDDVAVRIEKRLRRYKHRLKDHRVNGAHAETVPPELKTTLLSAPDADLDFDENWNPAVIAETTSALALLSVRDAVLELDLTGAPVLVFRHAMHGRVNMVYRRADGHIGWIDPSSQTNEDSH